MPTNAPAQTLSLSEQQQAERRAALRDMLDKLDDLAKKTVKKEIRYRWEALAFDLDISLFTIQHWTRRGYVPELSAKLIAEKYKRARIEGLMETLCPVEAR